MNPVPPAANKWTAFYLSLAVPGAGQLWAGSFTGLAWFVAAGLVAAFWLGLAENGGNSILFLGQFVSLTLLALISAEHAKRLVEPARREINVSIRERVCRLERRGRAIAIQIELETPLAPGELWRRVADLERFLTIDPFHERVVLMRQTPAAGVDLVLWHNAFGRRFARFGRILAWREGAGYALSDLSRRGPRVGFPHVFFVSVAPREASSDERPGSRLVVAVRGKWTSPLVPAALGQYWIWLVCREHARLLRQGI